MKFDVIIIGGGIAGLTAAQTLQQDGFSTALISAGRPIRDLDYREYEKAGGILLMGDSVCKTTVEGGEVKALYTENLGSYALQAGSYVIATGKYVGKGLRATKSGIREPLFNLDVQYDADRSTWFNPDFEAPQPFMGYGVTVDGAGHPSTGGQTIANLYACGEILAGVRADAADAEIIIQASADAIVKQIKAERDARA